MNEDMKKILKKLKRNLGYLIFIARNDAKLTQKQLAKLVKTKQSGISRAEKNGCDLEFAVTCLYKLGFTIDNNALRAIKKSKKGLTFASNPN